MFLRNLYWRSLAIIKRISTKRKNWYIISPFGIGDTYLLLSLMSSFRNEQKIIEEKIFFYVTKPFQKGLEQYFPKAVDEVRYIKPGLLKYISKHNQLKPGFFFIAHTSFTNLPGIDKLLGYKYINLNDIYKTLLNLQLNSPNTKPYLDQGMMTKAKEITLKYGLPQGKTVIVAPHAQSVEEILIADRWWNLLIEHLKKKGYSIAVLSKNEKFLAGPDVVLIDFPLEVAIAFTNICGYFIGLRSGLCDLVATSKAKKFILYPSSDSGIKTRSWAGLADIGIYDGILNEIQYSDHTLDEILNQV